MARRTVELFECDICTEDGERYTVQYPDGTLALDRCEKHASVLLKLRDEPGQWTGTGNGRAPFQVYSPDEIERLKTK